MSKNSDRKKLQCAMGEVSILPRSNKQRRKIELEVISFDWAEKEWGILAEEEKILTKTLNDVEVPQYLKKSLLEIPKKNLKIDYYNYISWTIGLAASIIFLFVFFRFSQSQTIKIKDIVIASAGWNKFPMELMENISERGKLKEFFVKNTNVFLNWKKLDKRFSLEGGKVFYMNKKPLLCSVWNTSVGKCILVEFRADDFELPGQVKKYFVDNNTKSYGECFQEKNCISIIWIKNKLGHVWVVNNSKEARKFFSLVN